ncbi:PREDICTED: probable membrane-associated kinase regulator 3 [Tarenaya hassleriana]|uniref:probable membrane-associated kinase regulator 3 n=1 Tax=Tarenaya hassleriana TaxID=28532 RepID=UPI00053C5A68|nr:PREDICTED: probable membrane-associated kinase regulator 3 [Tarenaya hassleriana]
MEPIKQGEASNEDDEYIDMDVSCCSSSSSSSTASSSGFISFSVSSPPHIREFEFQMCSSAAISGEPATSPADELFYKGQLLPLHLPPRLRMVQKLLESSSAVDGTTSSAAAAAASSAVISPCESRRVSSSEIVTNPDENFFEISTELKSFIENENPRSTWSKKIKQSSLTQKLKASRAYIRSFFSKPGCSDSEIDPKSKLGGPRSSKSSKKKNPFVKNESFDEFSINRGSNNIHRRSFSGVIQRHCQTKCSSSSSSCSSLSSSFSFGSNGSLDLQALMRSSSASSETDNSIEGAIAHCKQSFSPRKSNVSEAELCSSRTSVSGEI